MNNKYNCASFDKCTDKDCDFCVAFCCCFCEDCLHLDECSEEAILNRSETGWCEGWEWNGRNYDFGVDF